MRRKDREVTDFGEIIKIIDACSIMRLGLADGDYPYIVPVNFAYTEENGEINLYIHGAMAGRKYEMLKKNPVCSFEMDIAGDMEFMYEAHDISQRYMSVMGKAKVTFLEGEERQHAIEDIILARYPETRDFPYMKGNLQITAVGKLTVTEITAKANRPKSGPDI